VGKPKKPLVKSRYRWEDNIKMDLEEVGRGIVWSGSGKGHVARSCDCGNEFSGYIKCGEFVD
jgi:hypothetical protein